MPITVKVADSRPVNVDIQRSDNSIVRIEIKQYNGYDTLHIRQYFRRDDVWLPTSKGITLNPKHIPEVIAALKEVARQKNYSAE